MPAPKTPKTAPKAPSILDDIKTFMSRFVAFTDDAHADVLALWVLHTWAFDASYATPYIYITSAEKQSGKTRVIEVLAVLARNPVTAASVSAPSLFRIIEAAESRPTLFIDEVDAIFTGAANEDLRGILNSGYKRNGSVLRTVPGQDGGEVRAFSTFAPKLLAGIDNGAVPDTIADRSIRITLKRKRKDQEVERFISRKVDPDAEALRARIETWVSTNLDAIMEYEPPIIEELSDRAFEIAEPLLAVASRERGWTAKARKSITDVLTAQPAKTLPLGAQVLMKARDILTETGNDKLTSDELATAMDMSAKRIGVILAPYGITPRTVRIGAHTKKGYHMADFADAWSRYI